MPKSSQPTAEPFKITKRSVDAVFPDGVVTWRSDCDFKELGLKLTATGKKTYIYQYRTGGRESTTKRVTIGERGSPWTLHRLPFLQARL